MENRLVDSQKEEIVLMDTGFLYARTHPQYTATANTFMRVKPNLFDNKTKLILAPLRNEYGHWSLVVIFFRRRLGHTDESTTTLEVREFASFNSILKSSMRENLKFWLRQRYGLQSERSLPFNFVNDASEGMLFIPQQSKSSKDSGIYVCMFISYICFSIEFDFQDKDMKLLRKWVAHEIRHSGSVSIPEYDKSINEVAVMPSEA
jgi:Ulp1 family protease